MLCETSRNKLQEALDWFRGHSGHCVQCQAVRLLLRWKAERLLKDVGVSL